MASRTGKAAATKVAMTQAAPPEAPAGAEAQPALLPEAAPVQRGKGRPRGAVSRKTRDFLAYLEAMPSLEMPGVWLARRYSQGVDEILAEAGLSNTDENRRWADGQRQDAAKALAPYVHERRPQALQVEERRSIALTVQALDVDGEPIEADYQTIMLGDLLVEGEPAHADND